MEIDQVDKDWLQERLLNKRIVCAECHSPTNSNTDSDRGGLHLRGTAACSVNKDCKYYSTKYIPVDTRNLSKEFIPVPRYAGILKKYSEAPMQSSTSAGQTTCSDNKSLLYKRLSEVTKELSNIHEQLSITLPKKKELEVEYSNITKQLLNNRDQSEDDVLL